MRSITDQLCDSRRSAVFLFYWESKGPLPPDANPGQGIHHPKFGEALKDKLDALGIECVLRHREEYAGRTDPKDQMFRDMVAFFVRHFGQSRGSRGQN